MHHSLFPRRSLLFLAALVSLLPSAMLLAADDDGMHLKNWSGKFAYSPEGPSAFAMQGTASHVGKFMAKGEVTLGPGKVEGTLWGEGVLVLMDENGDLLVGETTWRVDRNDQVAMHFAWRDEVVLSDGSVAASTGRYAESLPPDMSANGIIAILIGLLAPAPL